MLKCSFARFGCKTLTPGISDESICQLDTTSRLQWRKADPTDWLSLMLHTPVTKACFRHGGERVQQLCLSGGRRLNTAGGVLHHLWVCFHRQDEGHISWG